MYLLPDFSLKTTLTIQFFWGWPAHQNFEKTSPNVFMLHIFYKHEAKVNKKFRLKATKICRISAKSTFYLQPLLLFFGGLAVYRVWCLPSRTHVFGPHNLAGTLLQRDATLLLLLRNHQAPFSTITDDLLINQDIRF
jgi:hypothetical protein